MKLQARDIGTFVALALMMAATRFYSHFGSAIHLPDASLAVFFLAGFFWARKSRPALVVFASLLLVAGGIDYYATAFRGVSDWCITPAYWFLIPTYAVLWFGGRYYAHIHQHSWRGLGMFSGIAFAATSVAFLISNGAFYLFSGRYPEMSVAEYAARVSQYYPQYLTGSLLYLFCAAALYAVLASRVPAATRAAAE